MLTVIRQLKSDRAAVSRKIKASNTQVAELKNLRDTLKQSVLFANAMVDGGNTSSDACEAQTMANARYGQEMPTCLLNLSKAESEVDEYRRAFRHLTDRIEAREKERADIALHGSTFRKNITKKRCLASNYLN